MKSLAERAERVVEITRVLHAPRERVFAAWTQARHLMHWFAPRSFTIPSCEADPRPGGVFKLCMRSPQGSDYWVRGEYREASAPERIVIACTLHDERGEPQIDELIDVRLAEEDGVTRLSMVTRCSGRGAGSRVMLENMPKGWSQTITRLSGRFEPDS